MTNKVSYKQAINYANLFLTWGGKWISINVILNWSLDYFGSNLVIEFPLHLADLANMLMTLFIWDHLCISNI